MGLESIMNLKIPGKRHPKKSNVIWGQKDQNRINYIKTDVNPLKTSEGSKKIESWRTFPEWKNGQYTDESLCSDKKGTIKRKNKHGDYIYTGICKDGKVWSGKMYFYDSDNILLRVENWKDGKFVNSGVVD